MCLPKYCWVCCWNSSVDGGAKFFSIFRLIVAVLQLVGTLENIITGKTEEAIEFAQFQLAENFKQDSADRFDENDQSEADFTKLIQDHIWMITLIVMSMGILYSLIDLIVCSLAIHGMRKAHPKMLLPYIIWTSFILMIPIALLVLIVALIIWLTIIGLYIDTGVVAVFLIFFIGIGLVFGWVLWDLLIMSSRYKQLKNAFGMDHMMLQEIPNDEKDQMLYPQLTKA